MATDSRRGVEPLPVINALQEYADAVARFLEIAVFVAVDFFVFGRVGGGRRSGVYDKNMFNTGS